MLEYQNLWNAVREELRKQYAEKTFEDTFENVKRVGWFDKGIIYVIVPNQMLKVKINNVYYTAIDKTLKKLTTKQVKFKFVLESDIVKTPKEDPIGPKISVNNLNPNYTFESFVVGESNKKSWLTATKVAEMPGIFVNPLYIFGNVGLGKTHLMQALGNYISDVNLEYKIIYIQAQEYLSDFNKACSEKTWEAFNEKYSNIDILLVDDIQMLCNKAATQEAFFNLFNEMIIKQKQVVITSDRPANKLNGFMDRLTSRFNSGIVVDINQPDFNQRIEILKQKSLEMTTKDIPEDVYAFIAENFIDNVRELEGALKRVVVMSDLFDQQIDLKFAQQELAGLIKVNNSQEPDEEAILSIIADMYNISQADLIGKSRESKFAVPRHISMYILNKKKNFNLLQISKIFSCHHTSAMYAIKKIESDINSNKEMKMAIDTILSKIGN